VRYRFRGLIRTTGQPVEGHVEADAEEQAFNTLAEHGIVTESLTPDPAPLNLGAQHQGFASAIDSALDTAAAQVPFDALADRYKGKNVWVLDRDKIRNRVAQVVDQAIREAQQNSEGDSAVRERVAEAINGLFRDNRNLTSQVNQNTQALEQQLARMGSFINRAESLLAQMTVAISRIGTGGGWSGGGGWGPRRFQGGPSQREEQNAVLLEIFKENLRLRGIEIDEPAESGVEPPGDMSGEAELQPQGVAADQPAAPAARGAPNLGPTGAAQAPALPPQSSGSASAGPPEPES
jgi:hypothetical protein